MRLNPLIFREYDVRGVVGDDLTPEGVEWLGRAFGTYLSRRGSKTVVVGGDCRLSTGVVSEDSPSWKHLDHTWHRAGEGATDEFQEVPNKGLAAAITRGLAACGLDVIDVGVVPTPVLYFSMFRLGIDAGVMVTGSHNPPEFNGFKLCAGKAAIHGEEIRKVAVIAESGEFASGSGLIRTFDIIPHYIDRIESFADLGPRKLKVVVDAGNGTGGLVAIPLFRRLGLDVIPLFCEMDGRFPNHHPDPTVPANVAALAAEVAARGADVGFAYDGDADRLGVITDAGEIMWGDMILLALARALLKAVPGAEVVSEVKCSQALFDEVARAGGRPVMWKVGHSLIKAKMAEDGALLGGEMSGHIFFRHRYYGFDDAIYASLRFLEILTRHQGPCGSLLADVPRTVATPEIRVACPDEVKFDVVAEATARFKARGLDVCDVDGARVRHAEGWGLVRASNTQPVLVLRFEARSAEALEAIQADITAEIERVKADLKR